MTSFVSRVVCKEETLYTISFLLFLFLNPDCDIPVRPSMLIFVNLTVAYALGGRAIQTHIKYPEGHTMVG